MLRPVYWQNEEACHKDGTVEIVTVMWWDYERKEGRAINSSGRVIDVYLTDYSLGDLTIGMKNNARMKGKVYEDLDI